MDPWGLLIREPRRSSDTQGSKDAVHQLRDCQVRNINKARIAALLHVLLLVTFVYPCSDWELLVTQYSVSLYSSSSSAHEAARLSVESHQGTDSTQRSMCPS